ncbi:MAG: type II restriction endonuclease [Candidatus Moranbacteria bacterium]|nr:type II restriction endonuclease [Candidatus Moranbacteria bacterium]
MMKKDFEKFVETLKNSIKTWEYFVNWEKVFENKAKYEITLNKLNYLLGKDDLEKEFSVLFKDSPEIVKALPILLAVRETELEIFDIETRDIEVFDFKSNIKYSDDNAKKYFKFIRNTGLQKLFKEDGVKNLVDYVFGVEVGLDSNGRKNRGGKLMEDIVEIFVRDFCEKNGLKYLVQANAKKIKDTFDKEVKFDKSSRSFDFAIFNPKTQELKLIETNFYNGGGSKLKSVCGEFRTLFNELKEQNIDFIWITDGQGWHTTKNPLQETYNHNEYVMNLEMLEEDELNKLSW